MRLQCAITRNLYVRFNTKALPVRQDIPQECLALLLTKAAIPIFFQTNWHVPMFVLVISRVMATREITSKLTHNLSAPPFCLQ